MQHVFVGSTGLRLALYVCRTLGALAEKCHAFAKALHYKEVEFAQTPETAVEALISINNQLRQPETAIGILAVAQNDLHMELKVRQSVTVLLSFCQCEWHPHTIVIFGID